MQNQSNSGMSWPAIMAFLFVGWGILTSATPLKSKRPVGRDATSQPSTEGLQDVPARLWQDPLEAARLADRLHGPEVNREAPTGESFMFPATAGTRDLEQQIGLLSSHWDSLANPIALLTVFVPGQPYPEESENRIRTRHAVLSSLAVLGYAPIRSDSIGYFHYFRRAAPDQPEGSDPLGIGKAIKSIFQRSDSEAESKSHLKTVIPFEVFAREVRPRERTNLDGGYDQVVVVWLDDSLFSENRIRAVRDLQNTLNSALSSKRQKRLGPTTTRPSGTTSPRDLTGLVFKCDAFMVGPTSSTGLIELLAEYEDRILEAEGSSCPPIRVFSPWATINQHRLMLLLRARRGPNLSFRNLGDINRRNEVVTITRTIGDDKQLANLLLQELALRGACPREPGNHTVILTEWDTHYGRAWKPLFETTVANRGRICQRVSCPHDPVIPSGNLHFFAYSRGVDGRLPKLSGSADSLAGDHRLESEDAHADAPIGRSQIDYIQRLTRQLLNLDERLRDRGENGITAIGILGSDLYDKLLILDALHGSFPRAQFFTTDLDARYLEPESYSSLRNLLVASHFGLRLRDSLQQSTPAFRDSYRSGVFLSCLKAIGSGNPVIDDAKAFPRIYEIGRGVAYDLNGGGRIGSDRIETPANDANEPSPRVRYWLHSRNRMLHLAGALFFGLLVIVPMSSAMQAEYEILRNRDGRAWKHLALYFLIAISIFGLFFVARTSHHRPSGEPFSLFAGISLWPTAIIRLLSMWVALYYGWSGYQRLKANLHHLETEFGLPRIYSVEMSYRGNNASESIKSQNTQAETIRAWFRRILRQWESIWIAGWKVPEGNADAARVWNDYLWYGAPVNRGVRTFIFSLLFFLFAICVFWMGSMPFEPYRGRTSFVVSKAVLVFSVAALIVLTSAILDATLLCDRLLFNLRGRRLRWTPSATNSPADRSLTGQAARSEVLKTRLVGEHTRVVASLIYYPFIVLFLMIAARHPIFDRWDFPPALVLVLVLIFLIAGSATWFLRRRAEAVRRDAIESLELKCFIEEPEQGPATGSARSAPKRSPSRIRRESANEDLIDRAIRFVRDYRDGSFGPLREDPVLRAVLIPFGGIGALQMLEVVQQLSAGTSG